MTDTSGGSPVRVVDDSVSLVTHDPDDRDSFPFFDLPPELRNMIYSFSVKDTESFNCYGIYDLKLVDYFQPSLRRISKQFGHEYEKEVLKFAAISSLIQPFRVRNEQYWQNTYWIRALTRVRLQINYHHYLSLHWIHKKLEECVSVFPSVVTILLRIDLFVYRCDDLIDNEYVTTEDLFQLPPVDGGRVKVRVELFLHSRLFKALNPSQVGDRKADRVFWYTPMVIFRASPSAGSHSYRGLDLEVESVGIFDESHDLCGVDGEENEWESLCRL